MYALAGTAGFYAAQGIWSLSESQPLIPLIGYVTEGDERAVVRFPEGDVGDVAAGEAALDVGRPEWVRAVLVADGVLTGERGRTDALIVHAVDYCDRRSSIRIAVPYRPHTDDAGFAVFRPRFLEVTGDSDPDHDGLGRAFFGGVDTHEQAAFVWNVYLRDESV